MTEVIPMLLCNQWNEAKGNSKSSYREQPKVFLAISFTFHCSNGSSSGSSSRSSGSSSRSSGSSNSSRKQETRAYKQLVSSSPRTALGTAAASGKH